MSKNLVLETNLGVLETNLGVLEYIGQHLTKNYSAALTKKNQAISEKQRSEQQQKDNRREANSQLLNMFSGLAPPTRAPLMLQRDQFFAKNKSTDNADGAIIDNANIFKSRLAKEWVLMQSELNEQITNANRDLQECLKTQITDKDGFDQMTETHNKTLIELKSLHNTQIQAATDQTRKIAVDLEKCKKENEKQLITLNRYFDELTEMESVKRSNTELNERIDKMRNGNNEQLIDFQVQLNTLRENMQEKENALANLISVQSANELLKKHNSNLNSQLDDTKLKCLDAESKTTFMDNELKQLQRKYENFKKTSEAKSDILSKAQESMFEIKMKLALDKVSADAKTPQDELAAKNSDLQTQIDNMTVNLNELKDENQQLAVRMDEINLKCETDKQELSEKNLKCETDKQVSSNNLIECREANKAYQDKIEKITELLKKCIESNASLQTQIDINNKEIDSNNKEILNNKLIIEENNNNLLKLENENTEFKLAQSKLEERLNTNSEAKSELDKITAQLLENQMKQQLLTELNNNLQLENETIIKESIELKHSNLSLLQQIAILSENKTQMEEQLSLLKIKEQFIEDYKQSLTWTSKESVVELFDNIYSSSSSDKDLDALISEFKKKAWTDEQIHFENVESDQDSQFSTSISFSSKTLATTTESTPEYIIRFRNLSTMALKFLTSLKKYEGAEEVITEQTQILLEKEEELKELQTFSQAYKDKIPEIEKIKEVLIQSAKNQTDWIEQFDKQELHNASLSQNILQGKKELNKLQNDFDELAETSSKMELRLVEQSKLFNGIKETNENSKLKYAEELTTLETENLQLKQNAEKNAVQIAANQQEIDRLTTKIDRLTTENNEFTTEIEGLNHYLTSINKQIEQKNTEISKKQNEIDEQTQKLNEIGTELNKIIDENITTFELKESGYLKQIENANKACDDKIEECKEGNNKMREAEIKIEFMKEQMLNLQKQIVVLIANARLSQQRVFPAQPSITAPTLNRTGFGSRKSRIDELDLKGGAPKKLFIKGGAQTNRILPDFNEDAEIVVIFNKTDKSVIYQYPDCYDLNVRNANPCITYFTDDLMEKYIQKIKDLKKEIAKLNAIIPAPIIPAPTNPANPAQPTIAPIAPQPVSALCSFVQQATNKDSALCAFVKNSANPVQVPSMVRLQELVRELILTKTMNQQIVKNLLIESIANKTNQQIVTMFDNKTQKLETEKQILAAEKTQLETDKNSLTSQLAAAATTAAATALTTAVKQAQNKAKESLNKGFMDKYVSFSEESKV